MTPVNNMKVVILCGGMGTRLKEETEFRPKPMVKIGQMPMLWHIMKIYSHYGYKDFVLCLGYKGDMIKEYFANYEIMNNDCTINLKENSRIVHGKEKMPDWNITLADTGEETNTGGRIKRIEKYIGEDNFLATYGDGVANIDINALVKYHLGHGKIATLTGLRPVSKYGIIQIDHASNAVVEFKEKPIMNDWISGGFFVFKRKIFDYLDDHSPLERKPFEQLAKEGQFSIYKHSGFWGSMDTFKDATWLNELWSSGNKPWKVWND